jgi:hypothetical protein
LSFLLWRYLRALVTISVIFGVVNFVLPVIFWLGDLSASVLR